MHDDDGVLILVADHTFTHPPPHPREVLPSLIHLLLIINFVFLVLFLFHLKTLKLINQY